VMTTLEGGTITW